MDFFFNSFFDWLLWSELAWMVVAVDAAVVFFQGVCGEGGGKLYIHACITDVQ